MEGFVKVNILNEERSFKKADFLNITPIIEMNHVVELKSISICLDQQSIRVLNIFLYFIIKVTKKLQLSGLENLYQKELHSFYLSHGLKINIIHYSSICAKVLNIKVEECSHIIYYLIYGRLATAPYVEAINKSQVFKQKKQKMKANNSTKHLMLGSRNWIKKHEIEEYNSDIEELKHELRQILRPSKTQNRKKGIKNIQFNDDHGKSNEHNAKLFQVSNSKYFNVFFPNRVQNYEKSAILQSKSESGQKKGRFLRKKRFNQHYIAKVNEKKKDKKQMTFQASKEIFSEIIERQTKLNSQNFQKMIQQIRNSSNYLDQIRNSIQDNRKKMKRKINEKYINNFINSDEFDDEFSKDLLNRRENEKKQLEINEKDDEKQNQNPFLNILQKNMIMKNSKEESSNGGSASMLSFTKKQNRLFKFKSEYRKFLKNQLFQNYAD